MSQMPHSAMVLAAGLGMRMRPLTDETPKPLIEVAGKALMDYALDRFAKAGVQRAIVNVHYLADQVEEHLAQRTVPEVFVSDERGLLLETGGGLKKARALLGDAPVFCTNTDAIMIDDGATEACAALAEQWDASRMDALLLLVPVARASGYDGRGDFDWSEDGQIALRSGDAAPFVFTGLQILNPALIDEGPDGPFSTRLLWDKAAARDRLHGVIYGGDWLHVGDAAGLAAAAARLSGPT
jgi:MurNAc alpha-1-phosphate uridylyltransferase